MTVAVYNLSAGRSGPLWSRAFARGARTRVLHGEAQAAELPPGPVAFWGDPPAWRILRAARAQGRTYFYGDHAYFGRARYFRCTRNALQHSGKGRPNVTRFRRFGIPVRPWRKDGRYIVVCPNSPTYLALHGLDALAWVQTVVAGLMARTDRPIIVRWKADAEVYPLAEALRDAWCTVVFTSNAGVESILAGVPCIALADCAARTLGAGTLDAIEDPPMPDGREDWAGVLAANQWTLQEYERGIAWRDLQRQAAGAA